MASGRAIWTRRLLRGFFQPLCVLSRGITCPRLPHELVVQVAGTEVFRLRWSSCLTTADSRAGPERQDVWPSRMHYCRVFGSSAHGLNLLRFSAGAKRGVALGPKSPLAKLRGNSHIRKFTVFLLAGRGGHTQGSLRQIGPCFPTAPEIVVWMGGDHRLAPCCGFELGTNDQLKLPPSLPARG